MFSLQVHRYIFIFGLCALAFGMMVGTVPTSVPQLILAGNWLIGGRFAEKWRRLNQPAAGIFSLFWILSVFYLAHVIGFFYSDDTGAAINDIRTKLPLLFLPLVLLSEGPVSKTELKWVLFCFVGGCVVNTAWCHTYSFVLHNNEVVRDASRFMSHIRLGLYLNMAIAVCLWYGWHSGQRYRPLLIGISLYLLASMVALGLAAGVANFLLLLFISLVIVVLRTRKKLRVAALAVAAVLTGSLAWYFDHIYDSQLAIKDAPQNLPQRYSPAGVPYAHFDTTVQRENGYFVLMNIELEELRRSWNREFPEDSFSYLPEVNIGRYEVLVRYMSSRGLIKDSIGYLKLSSQDKEYIRRGFTNYLQPEWNFLRRRSYELINDYNSFVSGRAVNGQSFTMRLYFWKATLHAIARQPLFGAGTGDVEQQLEVSYEETDSPLEAEWRKRPHNQFLTATLALGIAGLGLFLISLVWPVIILRRELHFLYWPFYVLALVSFLFEDTLESQAGLTFFAFFNSLFLCGAWFRKQRIPGDSQEIR